MDYTQARRFMALTTPLGEDALLLTGFHGQVSLNQLYSFRLDLLAENPARIDFGALLGQMVTVRIQPPRGPSRHFNGLLRRLTRGQTDQEFTHFQAEMVPRLWLATQQTQCRIFQQKSVPEIITAVLQRHYPTDGFTFRNMYGTYRPRDYCVQYRETDYAFVSRLMEEEGICYYHRHGEQGPQLTITDTPYDKFDPIDSRVPYQPNGVAHEDGIFDWSVSQEVRPGRCTRRDYTFEMPDHRLEESQPVRGDVAVGSVHHDLSWGSHDLEHYDYPGGYAGRTDGIDPGGGDRRAHLKDIFDDATRTIRLRAEEQAAQALDVAGQSNWISFYPGYHFQLAGHPDGDGLYLITQVEHSASLAGFRSGEELKFSYGNRFHCLPRGLQYRPRRVTPKLVLPGVQTAVVVGPPGQEIFVDCYGRVKVQFHWDRQGQSNADSSCWVRVAQVWAGNRWGAFFWPRTGQEVVVAFEEGDPDQPLIVGSVYNAKNLPPVELPLNASLGGFKSCIVGGDPGTQFNAIILHDTPGVEYVEVHSEKAAMNTSEANTVEFTNKAKFSFRGSF